VDGAPHWTLSARALLDWLPTNPDRDVFGCMGAAQDPPLARVRCPLLAWYGAAEGAGRADDLAELRRRATSAPRVDTRLVAGADHAYTDREAEVGAALAAWLDAVS
jgi:dienelactone hydrolase